MANSLANEAHQRSLKDFLTLYNTITEYCFKKCISNFNERSVSGKETTCVDICTDNYVQYNQRFMFNFVDHQERRKREQESEAAQAAAKEAAAAQAAQLEQLTPEQQEQLQKTAQLLEGLTATGSGAAANLNLNQNVSNNPGPSGNSGQYSSSVSPTNGNTPASSDSHVQNVIPQSKDKTNL